MRADVVLVDVESLPCSEPPEPAIQTPSTKLAAARAANRLAFHESKAVCADCGYGAHVARHYRCRWCGVYFCERCSVAHFAPTAHNVGSGS